MSGIININSPNSFGDDDSQGELPPPSFDFLVFSLRVQAEMQLGMLPVEEAQEPDIELAAHNTELLAVLQEKTKGNLTADEQQNLDATVAHLRLSLAEAKRQAKLIF